MWEVFDTNKASSLQKQEQMALENEAPLRSIETSSNDPPHTSPFSLPHVPFFFFFTPSVLSVSDFFLAEFTHIYI